MTPTAWKQIIAILDEGFEVTGIWTANGPIPTSAGAEITITPHLVTVRDGHARKLLDPDAIVRVDVRRRMS
jgi:hypothetical protein